MKATPAALLLLLLAALSSASAQSTTWTGATGLWDDDANWSDSAPTSSDTAYMSNGTAQLPTDTVGAYSELFLGTESGQSAALQITGGDLTSYQRTYLGYAEGATGSASISGGTWFTGNTFIGLFGAGDLSISGGSVSSSDVWIGEAGSPSNNSAAITGSASSWNTGRILVGAGGADNSLTIADGASVLTSQFVVGAGFGANNNHVEISGNATWTIYGSLESQIGSLGSGNSLTISNGASVSNAEGIIGWGALSETTLKGVNNSVTVSGQGSSWVNSGNLTVGIYGSDNTLLIEDGALVKVGDTIGETISFSTLGSSHDNYLRLDGGYIALFGNQLTAINNLIADGSIQLWDGSTWVTVTLANVDITYYENDSTGEAEAEAATGYSGLGGYTVATAQAVPEPGSVLLIVLGLAFLALRRRKRCPLTI